MMNFLSRWFSGNDKYNELQLLREQVQVLMEQRDSTSLPVIFPVDPPQSVPLQEKVVVFETADTSELLPPVTVPATPQTQVLTCMFCLHNNEYQWYLSEIGLTYNKSRPHQTYHDTYSGWLEHILNWHTEQIDWRLTAEEYNRLHDAKSCEKTAWSPKDTKRAAELYIRQRAIPEFGWKIGMATTSSGQKILLNNNNHTNPTKGYPTKVGDVVSVEWRERTPLMNRTQEGESYLEMEERESATHIRALVGVTRELGRTIPAIQKSIRGNRIKHSRGRITGDQTIKHGVCLMPASLESADNWTVLNPKFNEPLWSLNSRLIFTDEALAEVRRLRQYWVLPHWSNIGQLPLSAYGFPTNMPNTLHYPQFRLRPNHPYWDNYFQDMQNMRSKFTQAVPAPETQVQPTTVSTPVPTPTPEVEEPQFTPTLVVQTETGVNSIDGSMVLEEVQNLLPATPRVAQLIVLLQATIDVAKDNSTSVEELIDLRQKLSSAQEALQKGIDEANETTRWINEQTAAIEKSFKMPFDEFMEQTAGKLISLPTNKQQNAKDVINDINKFADKQIRKDKLDPDMPNFVH